MSRRNLSPLAGIALLVLLAASGGQAWAQGAVDPAKAEEASGSIVKVVIKILVKYVSPLLAIISALYGLTKGFKRGEWDTAALCIGAAITLALIPKILISIFGLAPGDIGLTG